MSDPHLREASWLELDRDAVNIASTGPPIWRWTVPLRRSGLVVEAYRGTFDEHRESQDAVLVMEYPDRLILAVADGATPTHRTPNIGDIDGAQYAAFAVLEQIRAAPPDAHLGRVLHTVNCILLDRFGHGRHADLHPRDRPQAAVVAASIRLSSEGGLDHVQLARAADCEAWVRRRSAWSLETSTPMLTEGPRLALARWDDANPDAPYEERIAHEHGLVGDRSRWNVTALGRFDRAKIESLDVAGELDELVLVTDGADCARFAAAPPSSARGWLAGLRQSEAVHRPHGRRHADVAMLHLTVEL